MIVQGDARHIPLRDQSAQCCVCSPPYWGLRDYGLPPLVWGGRAGCEHGWQEHIQPAAEGTRTLGGNSALRAAHQGTVSATMKPKVSAFCLRCSAWRGSLGLEPTPELYVQHLVDIFREVRRVLRDDGTAWLNLGDSYATGAGIVGDHPGGGEQGARWKGYRGERRSGKHAYLTDQMGPMTQPNRMPIPGLKPKDLVGIPWRVAFALQADGWWLRSDIIWAKKNCMPESVTDRPTRSHEYIFLLSKRARYYYDAEAIQEPLKESSIQRMSQPTFDQQTGGPKDYGHRTNENRSARKALCNLKEKLIAQEKWGDRHEGWAVRDKSIGRNRRSVWTIATQPYPEAHFATFPEALVTPCILAGCPVGGIVLDPFCGSGTVEAVAYKLGRKGIGMDLSTAYVNLSVKRARGTPVGLPLRHDRLPLAKG